MPKSTSAKPRKRRAGADDVRLTGDRIVVEHPDDGERKTRAGLLIPDAVFGLAWSGAMTAARLRGLITHLPDGLSEIYLHPATAGSFEVAQPDTMIRFMGLTGIPFTTVFNGCATGGSLLLNAANTILAGGGEVGIAVGLDKHPRGAFSAGDDMEELGLGQWYGQTGLALTTQYFGMKTQRYLHDHGLSVDCLHRTAVKAFKNGALNPKAWRRKALPYEAIASSPLVSDPLRQYHFCSPSEGAAAVVVCSAERARRHSARPIWIRANVLKTRLHGSFEVLSPALPVKSAPSPTVRAAQAAYEAAGLGPQDVDVAQVQDTEVGHELMHMAENGFCKDGEQEALVRAGASEIGGRLPITRRRARFAAACPVQRRRAIPCRD